MQIVRYKIGDIRQVNIRQEQQDDSLFSWGIDDYMGIPAHAGDAATFIHDGKIIGCLGIVPLWNGVGEVWCTFSDDIRPHKIQITKAAFKYTRLYQEKLGKYHRLQTLIKDTFEMSQRWAEFVGFKNEGLMVGFGPNKQNYYRYGRYVG